MKKKIAISIPNEGHTLPEAYDNHLVFSYRMGRLEKHWETVKRNPRYEIYWHSVGRILTPYAREILVKNALKDGMDYILMYDDDMLLPPDMFERMVEDMEEHPEIDVLAPLAFTRNPPHKAVIYRVEEGYDKDRHVPYYMNQFVEEYPKNELVECHAVGFGAVLINMRIVKKMTPPYFFTTTATGEDIYFCYQARKLGARIFMDTRIKLGHLSNPTIIDEQYVESWKKRSAPKEYEGLGKAR